MKELNFKDRAFIIAEIGANHEGNFDDAKQLVLDVAKTGVDAVKFQSYKADKIVSKQLSPDRHSHFKKFELTDAQFVELSALAEKNRLVFMSTPFDIDVVDVLDKIVPAFKIASADITNYPLLKKVAEKNKPILLSTGASTLDEVKDAANFIKSVNKNIVDEGKLVLLHCNLSYPTPAEDANLLSIPYLAEKTGLPVGYSDHTLGILAAKAAVALGARVIEKHFTNNKNKSDFRDHKLSADMAEMTQLVKEIREIEKLRGIAGKQLSNSESANVASRRSLFAKKEIQRGDLIKEEDLIALRPATGISPKDFDKVVGRKANRDIKAGELLSFDMLA